MRVQTGAGLYDHLLEQLAFHGGLDLVVDGNGDWETGPHHTAEDTAIAVGEALDRALGDRSGIARYGNAVVPMDDALAHAAVDLGGRRGAEIPLEHGWLGIVGGADDARPETGPPPASSASPGTCSSASPRRRG